MPTLAEAHWFQVPEVVLEAELFKLSGTRAAQMAIARAVVARMKANVHGPRVHPFAKRSFVMRDPNDPYAVLAGTRWKLAHLFEFGSARTTPHAWLRQAVTGMPGARFEASAGP
jgi:hypothetical protein